MKAVDRRDRVPEAFQLVAASCFLHDTIIGCRASAITLELGVISR